MGQRFVVLIAAAAALGLSAASAQDETAPDPAVAAEMTAAAEALIAAVNGPQPTAQTMGVNPAERLHHPFDSEVREDWAFWPRAREGLALGQMTAGQRVLAHELLETLLSARGYLQVQAIWRLEDVLAAQEQSAFPRGIEHAVFTIFGVPGGEEPWGWRVDGHHVALNVTVVGREVAVTPSFFGANPARVRGGPHAGLEPLRYETSAAFALLNALDDGQRARAVISDEAPRDILSGQLGKPRETWDAWREATAPAGLAASDLDNDQAVLLRNLVEEVISRVRPEIATVELRSIVFDNLSFAWMGATEEGAPHYFRVSGSGFVYEYDATGPDGAHIHSAWRDVTDDFGAAALARHYQEHPH